MKVVAVPTIELIAFQNALAEVLVCNFLFQSHLFLLIMVRRVLAFQECLAAMPHPSFSDFFLNFY